MIELRCIIINWSRGHCPFGRPGGSSGIAVVSGDYDDKRLGQSVELLVTGNRDDSNRGNSDVGKESR